MMNSALRFVCAVLTLLVFSISSVAEELDSSSNPSRVNLFLAASTVPYVNGNNIREEKQVHSFRIPGLVEVGGVLFAIAEANYDTSGVVANIDIVATYSVDNGKTWEKEVIIKNSGVGSVSRVVEPTVVAKGKKIYVLVGSFNTSDEFWADHNNADDWDPLLVIGEVKTSISADGKKTASITWGKPVSLKNEFLSQKPFRWWKLFVGGTRTGLVMRDGTIVFPLQIGTGNDIASSIMYSKDDGSSWTFEKGFIPDLGASDPSVIKWSDRLIMSCRMEEDTRRFYESFNMGKTWYEAKYKLSRVWGNAADREGPGTPGSFIAVNIEGMRVMLLTLPLNTKRERNRDRLNLWMSDNNRIFNAGQVSIGDENTGFSSLLYHGGKLYCAHEVSDGDAFSIVLATLDEHLERIKSTVKSWKQNDKKLSDLCIPVDQAANDKESKPCVKNIPTSGLVGWLAGDLSDNSWKDAYGCVDAKVTNAIATPYGAKFYGSGSGALWPVSAQGQNRRYFFAENAFTLAAIVSIHKVPEPGKSYPVIGGSWPYKGEKEVTALSYNSNRKWVQEYGTHKSNPAQLWKLNRKYHVAVSFDQGIRGVHIFCAYVDGKCLDRVKFKPNLYNFKEGIENLFIGGPEDYQKDMKGYITVSNVMLYNRKLTDGEIMTLSRSKYMIDERTTTISPSATLSLSPSLSLDPSAQVPKAKAPIGSPGGSEQTNSAQTTHTTSGSAPIQTNTDDEQKGNEKGADQSTHTALPQPKSPSVPPTKNNTVSAPSLPEKTTSDDSAGVEKTKDGSADTTTTNNNGGNPSREPKYSGSAVTHTEKNKDSNTDTSSGTSTSTPLPVEVRPNSDSGDASVSGFNPSSGAERRSDPTEEKSDKDNKSSNKSANENTHAALPQPKSPAVPSKNDNTMSASSLPENPTSDRGAAKAEPKDSGAGTATTNNSGGNASRESKDSGSASPPTEKNKDSNTETSSSTSTRTITIISTSVPVEVPSNRDSGDTSVTGLNMSNGEESKSDPPQVASDKQKKSNDGAYDAAGRAHGPLLSFLLSALLGFAAFC